MDKVIGIKVRDLIEMTVLKEAHVLAGFEGLDRLVTKVNVMEVPDIVDWVRTGEFLLTTAFSIKDDIERLNTMIPAFNKLGLAGMGIKTKRFVNTLPDSVLETANAHNFPLIEIPFDVSYSDIMMPVMSELLSRQSAVISQVNDFNRRLTRVMLRGGSLQEIARAINKSVGVPVAIVEPLFKTIVVSAPEAQKSILMESAARFLELNKSQDGPVRETEASGAALRGDFQPGAPVGRVAIPICSDDRHYGWVILWETNKTVNAMELSVIEASTSLIALDLLKKMSIYESANRHKVEFFDDLLSTETYRQQKALEHAVYMEFNPNLAYTVVIADFDASTELLKLTPNNAGYMQTIATKMVSILERISRANKGRVHFAQKSDRLIILFGQPKEIPEAKAKEAVMNFASEILHNTELEGLRDVVDVGIGRQYRQLEHLSKSKSEAKRALANHHLCGEKGKPVHYDALGIYKLLSFEALEPELKSFFGEMLAPLALYDREKDTNLIETLRLYFECGSNLKRVSEEMYTHYNTIIYRMQRIREISGLDLEDPSTRLNVQIALKIMDLIPTDLRSE
ncbi:PucR family transcriptional regulator [Acidaminobacter hydrogenoformans]|uniref:Purine catabolism regulatory protein n=1 Tax=Acidaminobacter hydrogenoformans DSM 2784 TaxID=1120920 RepID=A0A1G5RXT4_9FIRM|nr:PucR family transcriptional regulator [Acidaminobacter hydrogenoformans]SCZ78271.1 purine catabolism regulatory protein [Acidaminobacter hydrogenoformans DSM 2784]